MSGLNRLEERAEKIADPVERLRYLRQHAPAPEARVPEVAVRPGPAAEVAQPRRRRFPLVVVLGPAVCVVLLAAVLLWPAGTPPIAAAQKPVVPAVPTGGGAPLKIWQVDATETTEVYSNGLRIDTSFAVRNRPRADYGVYAAAGGVEPASYASAPRGIVYHTTESHLVPFEEESNRRLKRLGRNLLDVLRAEGSYHYLIDRFGRAFRVVEETDAANHAGKSVWADAQGVYVNLNDSFIGVAFEGQTGSAELITAAQVTTARQLTELLRERYAIAADNCVAHAQVSVNPLNMLIGNHSDWARDLPFAALGLPDNYQLAPASLTAFGFGYDEVFLEAAGKPWPGLMLAEKQVAERAAAEATTEVRYRAMLQHRYKQIAAAIKQIEIERAQGE